MNNLYPKLSLLKLIHNIYFLIMEVIYSLILLQMFPKVLFLCKHAPCSFF